MPLALRRWLDSRLFQLRGPQPGPIVLVHGRVFILPTSHGVLYGFVLLVMLAGSLNYTLSLGFVLTFLLAGLGLNGILYTFRNISNLRVYSIRPRPVFAGEQAEFRLRIENSSSVLRAGLEVVSAQSTVHGFDVRPNDETIVSIAVPTRERGRLRLGRVMLQTRFPLGLFRAWSFVELDVTCLVYPQPEPPGVPLPPPSGERGDGSASSVGNEDFSGLRAYHAGDSPRRIAWKADARGQGLLSKVFSGRSETHLWLDWNALPPSFGTEARLARLTRWVLDADAADIVYGFRLPAVSLEPDTGPGHRDRCLELLALYEQQ
jgi:uncharacterized protein (DUF58 family)